MAAGEIVPLFEMPPAEQVVEAVMADRFFNVLAVADIELT